MASRTSGLVRLVPQPRRQRACQVKGDVVVVPVPHLHHNPRAGPRLGCGPCLPPLFAAPGAYRRSLATIASMFRSASAVMVTKGLTPTLPGTREPSTT